MWTDELLKTDDPDGACAESGVRSVVSKYAQRSARRALRDGAIDWRRREDLGLDAEALIYLH